ncbi:MAG: DNA polymerase III subunit delta [Caldimicrobium sp.]
MPIFSPLQLLKLIDLAQKNRIAPIYLFIGPYEITLEKAKEISRVLAEKGCISEIYDLRDKEEKKIFLGKKGLQKGLFGVRTVYTIIAGEELSSEKVEEIINSIKSENKLFTWFLLYEEIDEKNPLYQLANTEGAIIPFNIRKKGDLFETELLLTLKEYQITTDKKTANLFLSLVGEDYLYFKRELEKLIFYCADKKNITEEDVKEVTIPSEDRALYFLGEALFQWSPHKTLSFLIHQLDTKKDPIEILGFLYSYFKKLLFLAEILKDNPELKAEKSYTLFAKKWQELKDNPLKELPKSLTETHPYALFLMKGYLEKVSSVEKLLEFLYEAEWELKREFKHPIKVFTNFVFNTWLYLQVQNPSNFPLM